MLARRVSAGEFQYGHHLVEPTAGAHQSHGHGEYHRSGHQPARVTDFTGAFVVEEHGQMQSRDVDERIEFFSCDGALRCHRTFPGFKCFEIHVTPLDRV